jgi:hypothetical protein
VREKLDLNTNQISVREGGHMYVYILCVFHLYSDFYGQLKTIYRIITALKSISGMVWDNEKGMGVTLDRQSEWDELTKVCNHISSLPTMSNHF